LGFQKRKLSDESHDDKTKKKKRLDDIMFGLGAAKGLNLDGKESGASPSSQSLLRKDPKDQRMPDLNKLQEMLGVPTDAKVQKWLADQMGVVPERPITPSSATATSTAAGKTGARQPASPSSGNPMEWMTNLSGDEHVTVFNRFTGKKLSGSQGPKLKYLAQWLIENPMFEVDPKWAELVKSKQPAASPSPAPTEASLKRKGPGRPPLDAEPAVKSSRASGVGPSYSTTGLNTMAGLGLDPKNPLSSLTSLDPKNPMSLAALYGLDPKKLDPVTAAMLGMGDPKNPGKLDPMMLAAFGMDAKTLQSMGIDPKMLGLDPKNMPPTSTATSTSGYSGLDQKTLQSMGLDAKSLQALGIDPKLLGMDSKSLQAMGMDPKMLQSMGIDPKMLQGMGVDPLAGLDAKTLQSLGLDPKVLQQAGVDSKSLQAMMGMDPKSLQSMTGLDQKTLQAMGMDPKMLQGMDPKLLQSMGLDAKTLQSLGIDPKLLGLDNKTLTQQQQAAPALDSKMMQAIGMDMKTLQAFGLDARALQSMGIDSKTLQAMGMLDPKKNAGSTPKTSSQSKNDAAKASHDMLAKALGLDPKTVDPSMLASLGMDPKTMAALGLDPKNPNSMMAAMAAMDPSLAALYGYGMPGMSSMLGGMDALTKGTSKAGQSSASKDGGAGPSPRGSRASPSPRPPSRASSKSGGDDRRSPRTSQASHTTVPSPRTSTPASIVSTAPFGGLSAASLGIDPKLLASMDPKVLQAAGIDPKTMGLDPRLLDPKLLGMDPKMLAGKKTLVKLSCLFL
jgi:hypothetical protein